MQLKQDETNFLITRFSILLLIYALLISFAPNSSLPLIIFVIGMTASLYKTRVFKWLVDRLVKIDMANERQTLVDAIYSYQSYRPLTLGWNAQKIKNYKLLAKESQHECQEIGYTDHLSKINECIETNSIITNEIANAAIRKYNISNIELKAGMHKPNSKIIESLCHFTRDWSELGDVELTPILDYINLNIKTHLSVKKRSKTLVIVPGSGLGRIAHELAVMQPSFPNVQSVEFSPFMYLANEFVYTDEPSKYYTLYPYIHTYSHHVSLETHTRSVEINRHLEKPDNLTMNLADIRSFQVPNMDDYDNVLIITAFFMDTAQNVFDYFRAIERLIGKKKGLWINVGPLKYGTAPRVEFTLEEFRKLRKVRGWKDLDEPKPYGKEIAGYLTDVEGLWQGYYGLGRWTSTLN